ncbi:MAG: hypothetical protein Q9202_001353 [Teloschistes flavicans]
MSDHDVQQAKPTNEYLTALHQASQTTARYLTITTSSPPSSIDTLVSEIKSHHHSSSPSSSSSKAKLNLPTPFLSSTLPQCYNFFKTHLRRPADADYATHPFTHFTFLAVDNQCIHPSSATVASTTPHPASPFSFSSDQTGEPALILLCSDVPDHYEPSTASAAPKLKTLRLPLPAALEYLPRLEDCSITPSEIHTLIYEDPNVATVRLAPPASWIPIPPFYGDGDERQQYKPGSAAEMREKKRRALRVLEESERVEMVD